MNLKRENFIESDKKKPVDIVSIILNLIQDEEKVCKNFQSMVYLPFTFNMFGIVVEGVREVEKESKENDEINIYIVDFMIFPIKVVKDSIHVKIYINKNKKVLVEDDFNFNLVVKHSDEEKRIVN